MTSVTAVPVELVTSRFARALVSNVTLGKVSAGRTPITSASALAWTRQGNPSQSMQRMHLENGLFSSFSMMPHGEWNGRKPAFARSSCSCWMRGSCDTAAYG